MTAEEKQLNRLVFILSIAILGSMIFCLVAWFTVQQNHSRIEHINSESPLNY
jgi:lipopolysaccharide export system protein LptC